MAVEADIKSEIMKELAWVNTLTPIFTQVSCRSNKIVGGEFQIKTENIKIFNENKKELLLDKLVDIRHQYSK
ncbi:MULTISPECIES: hypothetical protein [Exiguobacterium]|uniref:Uncharacterized protein n=1 Tax=Exiguobacterium acetylicum TaxID=41170 RepID=A0ABX8GF83_EXIAC|nr:MULTISPECIES: hypothetical protein [Exiguobacterium]QWB31792.1 hypothetical protein KKI46_16795 [Exiguobacterium acetylicum]